MVFSACFHLTQQELSFLAQLLSLSFLPLLPPKSSGMTSTSQILSKSMYGAEKAASVPISAAGWHSGMLGESHIAGLSNVGI